VPESDRLVFVQENAVNNVSQDFRLLSREGAAFADTGKRLRPAEAHSQWGQFAYMSGCSSTGKVVVVAEGPGADSKSGRVDVFTQTQPTPDYALACSIKPGARVHSAVLSANGKRLAYSAGGKVMVHDTGHLDDNTLPT
jgi:hypothetical protein